jgi:hypothetical protein
MWRVLHSGGASVIASPDTIEQKRIARATGIREPIPDELKPRDPNLYEQVLLAGHAPRQRTQRPQQIAHKTSRHRDVVRKADGLSKQSTAQSTAERRNPYARLIAIVSDVRAILDDPSRCEQRLWAAAWQTDGLARVGAVELLARVATARSVPVLLELAQAEDTHSAAVIGLVRLASPGDLAVLAAHESDVGLRHQLLSVLLERGTLESVGLYLSFVERADTCGDALAALSEVRQPPVEMLLLYLRAPSMAPRQAAAQVLGRIADPQLVKTLAAAIDDASVRKEALVALLLNSTPQAAAALREARENLYLVASVRAAEFEVHSLAQNSER